MGLAMLAPARAVWQSCCGSVVPCRLRRTLSVCVRAGAAKIHYRKCWPARSARVEGEISVNTGGCHGIIYSTKMTGLQAVPFNVSLHIFYGAGANDRLNRYGYGTLVFACTTATGTRTSANRTPTRGGRRVTKSPSSGHGFYGRSEHIWPGGFRSVVIHGR